MDTRPPHTGSAQAASESEPAVESDSGAGRGAAKSGRAYQILDCARLVAIVSIVWLHTPESPQLARTVDVGRFAVPFFTLASLFLAFGLAQRRPEMTLASYFASRARRIYVVFLAWSLIYGAVRLLSAKVLHGPRPDISPLDVLWNGTAHHLWFLPFICLASALGFAMGRLASRLGRAYWSVAVACGVASLAFAVVHTRGTLGAWGTTIQLSVDALPSVGLAISLAMIHTRLPRALFDRALVPVLGAIVWLGCLALLLASGRTTLLETLSGLGLMIASLWRGEVRALSRLASWGGLSLGIYVLHVLFLDGFQDVARKLGHEATPAVDAATFAFTMLACAASLAMLGRVPILRKLLI